MTIENLYNLYYGDAYRRAYSLSRDSDVASDLAQLSFCKLNTYLTMYPDVEIGKGYILRVVDNLFKSDFRNKKIQEKIQNIDIIDNRFPDIKSLSKLFENEISYYISDLPITMQQCAHMYFIEEKSPKEISKITHIKYSTIRSRIYRIRKVLCQNVDTDFKTLSNA